MDLGEREQLLRGIADGDVALRDVGGLSPQDVFAIARVGAAAMQGGRYTQAASVFSALIALEPRETTHRLHLALAHQGEGNVDAALAAGEVLQPLVERPTVGGQRPHLGDEGILTTTRLVDDGVDALMGGREGGVVGHD